MNEPIAAIATTISAPHLLILGAFVSIPIAILAIVVATIVWIVTQRRKIET